MVVRAAERGYVFAYAHDDSPGGRRAPTAPSAPPRSSCSTASGRVAYHGAIDDSTEPDAATAPYLRDALDAVLDGGPPAVAETPPVGCTIKWRR